MSKARRIRKISVFTSGGKFPVLTLSYINTALSQSAFRIYKCYIIINFNIFLSHFLKKLMLNRNYFLILSLVKKSFHHCVYILSRNREKQLCNKTKKSQRKPF